jgi:hypothetical protein
MYTCVYTSISGAPWGSGLEYIFGTPSLVVRDKCMERSYGCYRKNQGHVPQQVWHIYSIIVEAYIFLYVSKFAVGKENIHKMV